MSVTKTIDISVLPEAEQDLIKALFDKCYERAKPKEKTNPCGLKDGDEYYYITNDGQIGIAKWQNRASDLRRLALGNVFKTEKDTEFAIEKQKVKARLQRFADKHNDPSKEEWDGENVHYRIGYDSTSDDFITVSSIGMRYMDSIYFTSEEIAEDAANEVGVKRIMKYLFDVDCEKC